ncbi:hypothetical protein EMIT0P74_80128 [Pseudomonas sp. IT-P74]
MKIEQIWMVKSQLRKHLLRGGKRVQFSTEFAAVESADTGSFRSLAWHSQGRGDVYVPPFEATLTAQDEGYSLFWCHICNPFSRPQNVILAGDKTYNVMKTLVLRALSRTSAVDNANFPVDERTRAKLDVPQLGIENGLVSVLT